MFSCVQNAKRIAYGVPFWTLQVARTSESTQNLVSKMSLGGLLILLSLEEDSLWAIAIATVSPKAVHSKSPTLMDSPLLAEVFEANDEPVFVQVSSAHDCYTITSSIVDRYRTPVPPPIPNCAYSPVPPRLFPLSFLPREICLSFQTPPMPSAADCEAEGREDDGDDEDIQVFQCVCSTVRVLRRVRRTATGECVPIAPPSFSGTASHNGSSSSSNGRASHPAGGGSGGAGMNGAGRGWPEEKLSACPRCGVWGHTTCLEFDATAFLTKGVKGASGATGGVRKRGREGGKSSPAATPAAVPAEMAVGGTMDLSDVAGAGEGGDVQGAEISGFRTISATYDASWAYVDADVDTNAGPAAGQEVEEDGAAAAAPVIVVPVARPSPICWMCMQEKASSAAASLAVATGGGDGGASGGTAAPRREGKVSCLVE